MPEQVERQLVVAAAAEDVWAAVTAGGWLARKVDLDLRPGGDAEFRSEDELKSGWVEEASVPDSRRGIAGRLAFWWAVDDEPATRVELTLTPDGGETHLRVVESRPLDVLDLVGTPLRWPGGSTYGPALVAA